MKVRTIPLLFLALLTCSCAPRIKATSSNPGVGPLPAGSPVRVLSATQTVPQEATLIGTLKIGDNGFSKSGDYATTIRHAEEEAAKMGGNLLKITRHKGPDFMSTCHRIQAEVYRVNSLPGVAHELIFDSLHFRRGESVIHFYRWGGMGALVGYDVKLNDSVVTRAQNNWTETITVPASGEVTLSATTESTSSLTLTLQAGYHYYVRCELKLGMVVGRPSLNIADPLSAQSEIHSMLAAKQKNTEPQPTSNP